MNKKIPILLISGPVGVGKSTVGAELADILEGNRTPHTFVDFDQIRHTYPRPQDDPWGNKLGLNNLAAIWRNCKCAGARNLIVSYVIEDGSFIDALLQIIPEGVVTTIQLSASMDNLEARLRGREIGSGLEWHVNRAGELSSTLSVETTPNDHRINTDARTVSQVAEEINEKMKWRLS